MQNTVLFRRSSFFIDALNVFFYTDLFLYHELNTRRNENEFLHHLFDDKFPSFTTDNRVDLDNLIIQSTSTKKNQNILYDWVSPNRYNPSEVGLTMTIYLENLYWDMLANPISNEFMQVSELGNTIKLLSNDRQVNKIDIYLPFESVFIQEALSEALLGDKDINMIIGNKEEYLKSNLYDSYMFENVKDIDDYLINDVRKGNNTQLLTEIIIPTYEFNLEEGRTNIDKIMEQVTYYKLKLQKPMNEYMQDYKLSINSISVPL